MSFETIIALALFTVALLLVARRFQLMRNVRHYSANEVAEILKTQKPLLLDVRTAGEVRSGGIAGAINLPLHELKTRCAELEQYRGREIIVYCASGQRSVVAVDFLQKNGFQAVNMRGGWAAWRTVPRV